MNRATLTCRIDAFLEEKKRSSGGYAPVSPEDMRNLRDIIDGLLALKYEPDPDGDLPVEALLIDRTRFERPLYLPVMYAHENADGVSEFELHQRAAATHGILAQHSSEQASRHLDACRRILDNTVASRYPMELSGVRYVAKPPEGVTVDEVNETLNLALRKAYKRYPCPVDYTERQKWVADVAQKVSEKHGIKVFAVSCMHNTVGVRASFDLPEFDVRLRVSTALGEALDASRMPRVPDIPERR